MNQCDSCGRDDWAWGTIEHASWCRYIKQNNQHKGNE